MSIIILRNSTVSYISVVFVPAADLQTPLPPHVHCVLAALDEQN